VIETGVVNLPGTGAFLLELRDMPTKRELFAAMAMQGLLARGFFSEEVRQPAVPVRQMLLPEKAVQLADQLIAELAK